MKAAIVVIAITVSCAVSLSAQWPKYSEPGIPRDAQGQVLMDAPAPRTPDGKPDLTGDWLRADRDPRPPELSGIAAEQGRGSRAVVVEPQVQQFPADADSPPLATFWDIGTNVPGGVTLTPWAADVKKKRMAIDSRENPDANCLPMGIGQLNAHIYPRKIISTPTEVVIIYEGSGTTVREIFLDGRALPKDPEPWWNGYSVGHWEGDTLVVETTGLMDDGWLDVRGSPITNKGKITERFRRPSYGTLELEEIIEDASVYTKPFSARLNYRISTDTQLIEFVCLDKDASHYVGASTSAPGKTEAPK